MLAYLGKNSLGSPMKIGRTYAWTPHVGANRRSPLPMSVHKEICISPGMYLRNVKQLNIKHHSGNLFSVVPCHVRLHRCYKMQELLVDSTSNPLPTM